MEATGEKGVTVYCEEGGGPSKHFDKLWEEDAEGKRTSSQAHLDKELTFCTEECCTKYRVQPMCEKCGNFDKMRMYVKAPFSEEESEILKSLLNLDTACVPKDWRCIDCNILRVRSGCLPFSQAMIRTLSVTLSGIAPCCCIAWHTLKGFPGFWPLS